MILGLIVLAIPLAYIAFLAYALTEKWWQFPLWMLAILVAIFVLGGAISGPGLDIDSIHKW